MDKRIRLNHSIQIPDKIIFWLLFLVGSGYLFFGTSSVMEKGPSFYGLYTNSFGLVIVMYGVTYFGFYLPWTPQIYINDDSIMIRPGLFSKTALFNWADITELKLGIRSISFKIDGAYQDFKLNVSSSVSKDVKKSLREVATAKSIRIVGG